MDRKTFLSRLLLSAAALPAIAKALASPEPRFVATCGSFDLAAGLDEVVYWYYIRDHNTEYWHGPVHDGIHTGRWNIRRVNCSNGPRFSPSL